MEEKIDRSTWPKCKLCGEPEHEMFISWAQTCVMCQFLGDLGVPTEELKKRKEVVNSNEKDRNNEPQ